MDKGPILGRTRRCGVAVSPSRESLFPLDSLYLPEQAAGAASVPFRTFRPDRRRSFPEVSRGGPFLGRLEGNARGPADDTTATSPIYFHPASASSRDRGPSRQALPDSFVSVASRLRLDGENVVPMPSWPAGGGERASLSLNEGLKRGNRAWRSSRFASFPSPFAIGGMVLEHFARRFSEVDGFQLWQMIKSGGMCEGPEFGRWARGIWMTDRGLIDQRSSGRVKDIPSLPQMVLQLKKWMIQKQR